jgi:predicted heme/steroid binding protein
LFFDQPPLLRTVRKMKIFKREDLAYYDGQEGRPAYIAFDGRVYDVSGSFLWKNGRHQVIHRAGRNLTEYLKDAPHGKELLERVKQVGILSD